MIKNLYSYLENMLRYFSNDILGDDSLSDIQQFMKVKKKYNKKKKLFLYSWTYNGHIYLYYPTTTNKRYCS